MLYMTNQIFDFTDDPDPTPIMVVPHTDSHAFGLVTVATPHDFSVRLTLEQASTLAHEILTKLGEFHEPL